jgi:cation diffusion facilitator family transporter
MKQNNIITDQNRLRYGKIAGIVGLLCNLILSAMKIFLGVFSGAISVTADGLNNLSDAAASVITFFGFHFSSKPADRKHPYGHARYEYLAGLTISALMLVIAFELAKSSLSKILNPEPITVSPLLFIILIVSVLAKIFLFLYYRHVGKKINSKALFADAEDSRNDTLTTLCVILAAGAEQFTDLPIDAYASALLSLFLFYSSLQMAKKTISPLLGEGGTPEIQEQIKKHVLSQSFVIGCHDLMIHDYGPNRCYATLHVETDGEMNAIECHVLLDQLERECLSKFGTHLVIHHDPMHTNDPETTRIRKLTETVLKIKNEAFTLHDFRLLEKDGTPHISFDLIVPESFKEDTKSLQESLQDALFSLDGKKYVLDITLDPQQ